MTAPYAVMCELELRPSMSGGLKEALPAPTPSLLLVFSDLDTADVQQEQQVGAVISGPTALTPGNTIDARLVFWDDLGRIYATPGAHFKLWYAGRTVGSGTVIREVASDDP